MEKSTIISMEGYEKTPSSPRTGHYHHHHNQHKRESSLALLVCNNTKKYLQPKRWKGIGITIITLLSITFVFLLLSYHLEPLAKEIIAPGPKAVGLRISHGKLGRLRWR